MGAERRDGWNGSFEIMWTNPRHESLLQDRSGPWGESTKTGVVHGGRAPRQEWSMGGEHQDRSGPWEVSTKTGVVHGRRAPRQEWSMGGGHQDRSGPWGESTKTVVQKADGQRVHFTAFTAGVTITSWTVSSDTDSKEETVC